MALSTANIRAFGWKAPDFTLKGVDGKSYSLAATEKATETPYFCERYRMGTGIV